MGQPSLPHVTLRNQPASSARPANPARRSTFQPATTEAGTSASPWIAKIERGGALGRWVADADEPVKSEFVSTKTHAGRRELQRRHQRCEGGYGLRRGTLFHLDD